ncbi:MAG: hypothetical protein ABI904_18085 [Chloroflexota bacterium]
MNANLENPLIKILIAIIGAVALIIVAVIGYNATVKSALLPIQATQTAEARLTAIAMTNQSSSIAATETQTAASLSTAIPPEILGIQTRKTGVLPDQTIFAEINFRDLDGDSYLVVYEFVDTTSSTPVNIGDDQIFTSEELQIAGTILTIPWYCQGQGYTATFNVVIKDTSGNESNKVPLTFDCT